MCCSLYSSVCSLHSCKVSLGPPILGPKSCRKPVTMLFVRNVLLRCSVPSYWMHLKLFEVYSCRWLWEQWQHVNPPESKIPQLSWCIKRIYWHCRHRVQDLSVAVCKLTIYGQSKCFGGKMAVGTEWCCQQMPTLWVGATKLKGPDNWKF